MYDRPGIVTCARTEVFVALRFQDTMQRNVTPAAWCESMCELVAEPLWEIRLMTPSSSVGRTTLAFSVGSAGLAIAFVAVMASAVMLSGAPHGVPAASDYRWAATVLLLLIAGFFATLLAARRAALPIPPARTGVFAGLVGVSLLLATMMLVGKPLGMRGPMVIAILAGVASAAGAVGRARTNRPTEA